MTIFHLIRHAAHGQLGRVLTGRTGNAHLSDLGRRQAQAVAARLQDATPDAILSSPQPRARETAAPIAAATRLQCCISSSLDEIDFGAWDGRTFQALETDPIWKRWNDDRDNARTPGNETMADVAARVLALIDDLRREFPDGRVALVSHSDVIKAAICRFRRLSFQSVHDFEVAPASITTVAVGDGRAEVLRVNETIDLPALEAVP